MLVRYEIMIIVANFGALPLNYYLEAHIIQLAFVE